METYKTKLAKGHLITEKHLLDNFHSIHSDIVLNFAF
jgi:hypothetical protein